MEGKPVILIVATRCHPEDEEKFNRWYDETHVPGVFEFDRLKKVTRYKAVSDGESHDYLAIYEFDSQQDFDAYEKSQAFIAAHKEMREFWKVRCYERLLRLAYQPVKVWER